MVTDREPVLHHPNGMIPGRLVVAGRGAARLVAQWSTKKVPPASSRLTSPLRLEYRAAALGASGHNVPGIWSFSPLVVSVTLTSVKTTAIGGLQDGEKTAVTASVQSAFPLWTGKVPSACTNSLLPAFG